MSSVQIFYMQIQNYKLLQMREGFNELALKHSDLNLLKELFTEVIILPSICYLIQKAW